MYQEQINQLLQELKQEWSYPDGFFVKARYGEMDSNGYYRVISILERISIVLSPYEDETTLDRNLVLRLWHIPEFLRLRDRRIYEVNDQCVSKHWHTWCRKIINLISKIFGYDSEEAYQKLKDSQDEVPY